MRKTAVVALSCCVLGLGTWALLWSQPDRLPTPPGETPGSLRVLDAEGKPQGVCPLKHTDVEVAITGFLARVTVKQQFQNPYKDKIEAVYTFPLSQDAAVDDMEMKVGRRTIRGEIRKREEARQIYQTAKQEGKVASLLDQERPNIFTQSVANILPGENVTVTLRYTELIKYEEGEYEFVFPMVVGPRYMPGSPTSRVAETPPEMKGKVVEVPGPTTGPPPTGTGWSPDTDQVPDASKISPPVTAPGTRAGHDLSLTVRLDGGRKLQTLESVLHEVETESLGQTTVVTLKDKAVIPNKDFILRYSTATDEIGDALFTHASDAGRFFTLVLEPPKRVPLDRVTPKELVFVLDVSGSMSGYPLETAKATMKHCLDRLNPADTFNFVTFAGATRILFDRPVPATPENVQQAQTFLTTLRGGGGTEMMKAIKAALDPSDSQKHVRIVCFMTDGYVGNDMAILGEIKSHPNARVFSFGIGRSVNRFLLDNMARQGRGEVQFVQFGEDAAQVAERFYQQFRNPVLTGIELDWGNLPVTDLYPQNPPDLYSAKPLIIRGRFTGPAKGDLTLRGKVAGQPFERRIAIDLPKEEQSHEVLGPLWARARIDELMAQDWQGIQRGNPKPEVKDTITNLGLEFRLMTQFTSFVAVEEVPVTEGGAPRTITVPVEMPEGVSYEGVFGKASVGAAINGRCTPVPTATALTEAPKTVAMPRSGGGGFGGGFGGGIAPMPPRPTPTVGGYDPRNAVVINGAAGQPGPPGPNGATQGGKNSAKRLVDSLTDELGAELNKLSGKDPKVVEARTQQLLQLQQRLDPVLHGLADKVAKQGKAGNLKLPGVEVKNGVVEVAVWLRDDSEASLAKLKTLGFQITTKARAVKLLVGKIDVKKLEDLALLDCVLKVEPPKYGK